MRSPTEAEPRVASRVSVLRSAAAMQIHCPVCQRDDEVPDTFAYRPFCSRRCKMIDLGNWLDEVYRVATPGDTVDPSASGSHRALPLMLTADE